MRKLVIAIIVLFAGSHLYAQEIDISVKKSEVFKDDQKKTFLLFSESDGNGGLISVRSFQKFTKTGYYINQYNADLKLLQEYTIDSDHSSIEGILIKDNQVHLIEMSKDKKAKSFVYNVLSSPIDKFNFSKRNLLTINQNLIKKYFYGFGGFFFGLRQFDNDSFGQLTFSKEKNYFVINFDINDKKSKKEAHKIFVFNNNFEQLYVADFKKDIKDRDFSYQDIDIDDKDGSVYFVGKSYEKKVKGKKKVKINYHYEIYKIDQSGQKMMSFKTADHFVGSLYILHNEDELIGLGFYSKKNEYRYKGVFKYVLNPTDLSIKSKVFLPFSEQFITDKYGKVKNKELKNLSYRRVYLNSNGDLYINAEEYYVTSYYVSNGNGGGYWKYVYHYNDIVAVKIDNKDQLSWARNINKKQIESSYNVHSYFSTVVNDKNYFFINISDNIKEIRKDRIQFMGKSAKRSNLYTVVINEKGDFKYKKILDDKDNEVAFNLLGGAFVSKNNNEIIFLGRKKSKKQLLKITIN